MFMNKRRKLKYINLFNLLTSVQEAAGEAALLAEGHTELILKNETSMLNNLGHIHKLWDYKTSHNELVSASNEDRLKSDMNHNKLQALIQVQDRQIRELGLRINKLDPHIKTISLPMYDSDTGMIEFHNIKVHWQCANCHTSFLGSSVAESIKIGVKNGSVVELNLILFDPQCLCYDGWRLVNKHQYCFFDALSNGLNPEFHKKFGENNG